MSKIYEVKAMVKADGVTTELECDVVALDPWSAIKKALHSESKRFKEMIVFNARAYCRDGYKWK